MNHPVLSSVWITILLSVRSSVPVTNQYHQSLLRRSSEICVSHKVASSVSAVAVCDMGEISPEQDWILVHDQFQLTQVVPQVGRECRDWVHGEIRMETEAVSAAIRSR